jgi:hypothetical protein
LDKGVQPEKYFWQSAEPLEARKQDRKMAMAPVFGFLQSFAPPPAGGGQALAYLQRVRRESKIRM